MNHKYIMCSLINNEWFELDDEPTEIDFQMADFADCIIIRIDENFNCTTWDSGDWKKMRKAEIAFDDDNNKYHGV